MLLSVFVSFLLAIIFRRKPYVLFMAICLLLISFFSVGVPTTINLSERSVAPAERGILLDNPLPLSFPLYASLYVEKPINFPTEHYVSEKYQLYFFTSIFHQTWVWSEFPEGVHLNISWVDYTIFYSFFMLINMVGAIIGYWLSKTTFIDKLLKKRTKQ